MCFNKAKSSTSAKTDTTDARVAASDNAVALGQNASLSIQGLTEAAQTELYDFLAAFGQGAQDTFKKTVDALVLAQVNQKDAVQGTAQASQNTAKDITATIAGSASSIASTIAWPVLLVGGGLILVRLFKK